MFCLSRSEPLTEVDKPEDHLLRGVLHSDHVRDLLGHVVQAVTSDHTVRRYWHSEFRVEINRMQPIVYSVMIQTSNVK